jgi:hypothetical protein
VDARQTGYLSDFHQHNLLGMSEAMTMKMRGHTAAPSASNI